MTITAPRLSWLPIEPNWRGRLKALRSRSEATVDDWQEAVALANTQLDFVGVNALDEAVRRLFKQAAPPDVQTLPVRVAVLGSCTLTHLHAAIRVGALRSGIQVTTYEGNYGQYLQELLDGSGRLHAFRPDVILLSFDAFHLAQGVDASLTTEDADVRLDGVCAKITQCWDLAREKLHCRVLQQTVLNVHPPLLGSNEHRLPGSPQAFIARLNAKLRDLAEARDVDLVAVDTCAARDGLAAWHDPALWHRSKQDVTLSAAPMYGELVGRIVAARQGRSFKCLVMDLDNTLWGGVIGDDGLDGIVIGQGDALGECFVELQNYALQLARRGVILAVCSKNDEPTAAEPFERHPDMVLKRGDIACFVANWTDKATNIRSIAHTLSIGLDAMVFLDDNPFERNLVRRELPMVAVPEIPEDPALVTRCLAEAGYFESLGITAEDRARSAQYQSNISREILRASCTDLAAYLRSLDMELTWTRFDRVGLARTVQLINKTNQFNVTTRRYTEDEVLAVIADDRAIGLQMRLVDRFGDNGVIAIVIARFPDANPRDLHLDTWLMSCRVLGRQVEQATLNVVAEAAQKAGAARLIGEYRPTRKNGMVSDLYARLGFSAEQKFEDGRVSYSLDLDGFAPHATVISIKTESGDERH